MDFAVDFGGRSEAVVKANKVKARSARGEKMSRPVKREMTPEAKEREQRYFDALRARRQTQVEFCNEAGFYVATVWRWVGRGDSARPWVTRGKAMNTAILAEALGIDVRYLTPGGPSLFKAAV